MFDENRNQFVGFMAVLLCVAGMLYIVTSFGNDPEVAKQVTNLNPWVGSHIKMLMWIAVGVIMIAGAMLPYLSMTKDDGRLEFLGAAVIKIVIALAVPALFFVLGVAWCGAKHW